MSPYQSRFEAIGTSWKIVLPETKVSDAEPVIMAVKDRVAEFDKAYSRFRDDSIAASISKAVGSYRLPDDAKGMFDIYKNLYEVTRGKVTPLIGQVLADAGYDKKYSLKPKEKVAPAAVWDEVMSYEYPDLLVKKPVLLDFGAVGKGYLIDIVASLVRSKGIRSYTIDAGGDIAHLSEQGSPIKVGLEDPTDKAKVIGIAELPSGKSIAGSAGNRRAWDKYTHIMDPETAESPRHIQAVWAVADTAASADAVTTGLYFASSEALKQRFGFEYLVVNADRSAYTSPGFPGRLFD